MCNNTEVSNRLRHQVHGSNNTLRKLRTGNNSTQQCGSRTLRHQHRSNRSTTLHMRSFLTEALNKKKVNIKIYTDSSSGKSMATRIGSSKKAKHIELKRLFIQQLVLNDIVRIIKVNAVANPADIFTKFVATETLLRHLNEVGINTQPDWTTASKHIRFTWRQPEDSHNKQQTARAHLNIHLSSHGSGSISIWSISTLSSLYIYLRFLLRIPPQHERNMIEDVCEHDCLRPHEGFHFACQQDVFCWIYLKYPTFCWTTSEINSGNVNKGWQHENIFCRRFRDSTGESNKENDTRKTTWLLTMLSCRPW